MERLAYRGGRYSIGAGDGLFALALDMVRTNRHRGRGFRPALAPDVGSFMAMAVRSEQEQKGVVSAPDEGEIPAAPRHK